MSNNGNKNSEQNKLNEVIRQPGLPNCGVDFGEEYRHSAKGGETARQAEGWEKEKDNSLVKKIVVSSSLLGDRDLCTISVNIDPNIRAVFPEKWESHEITAKYFSQLVALTGRFFLHLVYGIPTARSASFSHSLEHELYVRDEKNGITLLG